MASNRLPRSAITEALEEMLRLRAELAEERRLHRLAAKAAEAHAAALRDVAKQRDEAQAEVRELRAHRDELRRAAGVVLERLGLGVR